MYSHRVQQPLLWAWTSVAMTAPLAYYAGRCHWVFVLFIGVLCGLLCQYVLTAKEKTVCLGVWYSVLQFLWLGIALGEMVRWSAMCWPNDSGLAVSLILLALAASAAACGTARAAGVCGVLVWGVGILYIILAAAGISNLHPKWLKLGDAVPKVYPVELIFVFLLPVGARTLGSEQNKKAWIGITAMLLFGTLLAMWTIGGLSEPVSREYEFPFYEFCKSLQLVGSVKRFEALIAVALTVGFFGVESMLLSLGAGLAEAVRKECGKKGICISALIGAAAATIPTEYGGIVLAAGSLIFWGLQPFFTIQKEKIKSRKKGKKGLDNRGSEW